MIDCGGCGREIDPGSVPDGIKFMCSRCYRVQAAGEGKRHRMSTRIFLAASAGSLLAAAAAGIGLCVLFLLSTGMTYWFLLLTALLMGVVVCPAVVILKIRNLNLLAASLYIPLGLWSFAWRQAPGVSWLYGGVMGWAALLFWAIGLGSLIMFLSDLGVRPRL